MPARQHRDGAGREACPVRGRIDAAREAGHDGEAGGADLVGEKRSDLQAGG
jgi:hypothetical protein